MNLSGLVIWLARMLAILGGLVLVLITVITVGSIAGRAILTMAHAQAMGPPTVWLKEAATWLISLEWNIGRWTFRIGPIPGDFELVEAMTGFAVFSFLPWCQLNRGHATVDVFTSFLSPGVNRIIDVVTELLMTFVIVLIAWRLWHGMQDKIRYNETTFILQFPVWWGFAAAMAAVVVAVIVSFFVLYVRVREAATGRTILQSQGAVH